MPKKHALSPGTLGAQLVLEYADKNDLSISALAIRELQWEPANLHKLLKDKKPNATLQRLLKIKEVMDISIDSWTEPPSRVKK